MITESPVPQNENNNDTEPVLTLIKQIKENKLDPRLLSAEDRCRCVDVLGCEGYSAAEMAQILKVGERTIFRDRTELRAAHALRVDSQFAPKMAGELIRQAECSIARLRRIAREAGASAMERCMAENFAFKTYVEMLGKLQSMGYLPRVPNSVVAQVVGASGDVFRALDQSAQRLKVLDLVDREIGQEDPEQLQQRRVLEEIVRRARLAAEVDRLSDRPPDRN